MDDRPALRRPAGVRRAARRAPTQPGLRVLMDLVPNHCSAAHPWFVAALGGAAPGRPSGTGSCSAGRRRRRRTAAQQLALGLRRARLDPARSGPDQWYLHSFDASQPDFNWRNPEVVAYFEQVLRFWFDRGVDGFRIDVAHMLVKHADLPDWPFPADGGPGYNAYAQNQPEVHEVFRALAALGRLVRARPHPGRRGLGAHSRGSRPVPAPGRAAPGVLLRPAACGPGTGRRSESRSTRGLAEIAATGATITWTLANHDVHRAVTRFGLIESAGTGGSTDPFAHGRPGPGRGRRTPRASAGPGPRCCSCSACPARCTCTRARSWACRRCSTCPTTARQDPIWLRSGGAGARPRRLPGAAAVARADGPSLGFGPDQGARALAAAARLVRRVRGGRRVGRRRARCCGCTPARCGGAGS